MNLNRNCPHPGPLPSDGRGRQIERELLAIGRIVRFESLDTGSLSHQMGEGQDEGIQRLYLRTT